MADIILPGNATPTQVLSGQTFSAGTNYDAAGSMPNNGALGTIVPSTSAHSIPAGYTSGGSVEGDANLVAANILSGKSIFGVAGNVVAGKQAASGSATTSSSGMLTVSGLGFTSTPQFIIWCQSNAFWVMQYYGDGIWTNDYPSNFNIVTGSNAMTTYGLSTGSGYVNNTGFSLYAWQSSRLYYWWAYGP